MDANKQEIPAIATATWGLGSEVAKHRTMADSAAPADIAESDIDKNWLLVIVFLGFRYMSSGSFIILPF